VQREARAAVDGGAPEQVRVRARVAPCSLFFFFVLVGVFCGPRARGACGSLAVVRRGAVAGGRRRGGDAQGLEIRGRAPVVLDGADPAVACVLSLPLAFRTDGRAQSYKRGSAGGRSASARGTRSRSSSGCRARRRRAR
jgi:hypothetical protein